MTEKTPEKTADERGRVTLKIRQIDLELEADNQETVRELLRGIGALVVARLRPEPVSTTEPAPARKQNRAGARSAKEGKRGP